MKRYLLLFAILFSIPMVYSANCKNYCQRTCRSAHEYHPCYFFFDADFGAYRLQAPDFAFGEILGFFPFSAGIADIPEFAVNHERVDGFYPRFAIGMELPCELTPHWMGTNFRFELAGFYFSRDFDSVTSSFTLSNFAFPNLNGSGDFISSLLGIPTVFNNAEFEHKYRYSGIGIKFASDYGFYCISGITLSPFIEFDYNTLHQGYTIEIGSIVGPSSATHYLLDEDLDTHYYDLGFGFDVSYAFSSCFPSTTVFAQGALFGSYAHTDFNGIESAIVTPTTSIGSTFDDTKGEFNYKTRAQLGLGYEFSPNFALSIMGQIESWGYIPGIQNPHRLATGIYDHSARIVSDSATNYAALVKVFIRL